jgi:cobaltochelatase CobT
VDMSGSMNSGGPRCSNSRSYYAQRTAIALAETLQAIGIPFEVCGFHNVMQLAVHAGRPYTRWAPFHIIPFKKYDEQLKRVRGRFADMRGRQNNGDGDAVRFMARRVAGRPEKRKMLIVISDGIPAGAGEDRAMENDLHLAIREATSAGIEVHGVGANYERVADFYNKRNGATSTVITDLATMATQLINLLRARLLKKAA